MKLTKNEKRSILNMNVEDTIIIDDYNRSNYQYEVQRLTENEYCVSKMALCICVASEHFFNAHDVIEYIDR